MISWVLLPGMDGTGRLFAPFVAALGNDVVTQIIAYPCDQAMDYAGLDHWVRARLPDRGPFVIVAESFSGPIAISLAASPPPGLLGICLCCTFARNPRPAFAWLRHFLRFAPLSHPPHAILDFLMLGKFGTDELRRALADAIAQLAPDVLEARLQALAEVDVRHHLAAAKVPVRYLQATHDRLVPTSAAADLTSITRIDGPHLLLQARPDESAAEVKKFVRGLA